MGKCCYLSGIACLPMCVCVYHRYAFVSVFLSLTFCAHINFGIFIHSTQQWMSESAGSQLCRSERLEKPRTFVWFAVAVWVCVCICPRIPSFDGLLSHSICVPGIVPLEFFLKQHMNCEAANSCSLCLCANCETMSVHYLKATLT